MNQSLCTICKSRSTVIYKNYPGYRGMSYYDIYYCDKCNLCFVLTEEEEIQNIYKAIYKSPERVPGFSRYYYYLDNIVSQADPLLWLANQEDPYHILMSFIDKYVKKEDKILEIGCGLGYTTYALRAMGYNAIGIDHSDEAINRATIKFGDGYSVANLKSFMESGTKFDKIILTEVLEHISEPVGLLNECRDVLSETGHVLVTTPNKEWFSQSTPWAVEAPPVHLFWFSKTSLKNLANRLNAKIEFIEKNIYHDSKKLVKRSDLAGFYVKKPVLDVNYNLCSAESATNHEKYVRVNMFKMIRNKITYRYLQLTREPLQRTVGAVFSW